MYLLRLNVNCVIIFNFVLTIREKSCNHLMGHGLNLTKEIPSVNFLSINFSTTSKVIHQVDKRFISFAIDSYDLYNWWKKFDLKDKRLCTLTKYLQPAYLRIGGTAGDALEFSSGNPSETGVHLMRLNKFVEKVELDLIFGLNILLRNNHHWNSSNAFKILQFMSRNDIKVAGWELGNEPNRFQVVFNTSVTPKHISNDFSHLRHLLNKFPLYKNCLIIGPDITNPSRRHFSEYYTDQSSSLGHLTDSGVQAAKFLRSFLKYVIPNSLDVVSIHQYYFDGKTSTINDFLNITIMNSLLDVVNLTNSIIRKNKPGKYLWLGETSTAWAGGTPNVSNTFVGVFTWLDKLGQSAINGVQVVIRQTLKGDWYGLINDNNDPTPDYFVTLLFKKIVGEKVLSLQSSSFLFQNTHQTQNASLQPYKLRFYAHCAKTTSKNNGAVTMYIINPYNINYLINVEGQAGTTIEQYLLTAPKNILTSTKINLNGKALKINRRTNKYPELNPKIIKHNIEIPNFSIGFWILKHANVEACKTKFA